MKKVFCIIILAGIVSSCLFQDQNPIVNFVEKISDQADIMDIVFESEGTAWVSSFGYGLFRIDTSMNITEFNSENSLLEPMPIIMELQVDSHDQLWFIHNGLVSYDGIEFSHYDFPNSQLYSPSLIIDDNDTKWMIAYEFDTTDYVINPVYYLIKFDESGFHVCEDDDSIITGSLYNHLTIDNDNNVWMCGDSNLYRFDGIDWTKFSLDGLGINSRYISKMAVDHENRICMIFDYFLSESQSGDLPYLFIYDQEQTHSFFNEDSYYFDLLIDSNNRLWLLGNKELLLFDGADIEHTNINRPVNIMAESPNGEIWMGGNKGIYVYEKND